MQNTNYFFRQNEPKMLDMLYAQRILYNSANILEAVNVCFMFLICVFNFYGISNSWLQIFINILLVAMNKFLFSLENKKIKQGAKIKKYFDYKLFEFDGLSEDFQKECKGYIFTIIDRDKNKEKYLVQVNNNGESTARGVKDWYIDEQKDSEFETIKSMQLQNLYWDKTISNIYLAMLSVLALFLIIIYIVIVGIRGCSILEIVTGLIPFFNIIGYLINKFALYCDIRENIAVAKSILKRATKMTDLVEVQTLIDERRMKEFTPPDFIHKVISKNEHKKIKFMNNKD